MDMTAFDSTTGSVSDFLLDRQEQFEDLKQSILIVPHFDDEERQSTIDGIVVLS